MGACAEDSWVSWPVALREKPALSHLGTGLALPLMLSGGSGGFSFSPSAAVFGRSSQVASERISDLKEIPPGLLGRVAKGHWKL